MHNERVTITLPAELLEEARAAVGHGVAASISVYIAEAVAARQLRERSLATLASLYGGPPPSEELDEARAALRPAPPLAAF
jgi:antitoxin ParD1/3/4